MGLQHGSVAVHIHDESRQEVAFAVHKTVGVVVMSNQVEGLAHLERFVEALGIEPVIDFGIAPCQDSHCDASYLIVAYAYLSAVACDDTNDVALFDVVGLLGYGT